MTRKNQHPPAPPAPAERERWPIRMKLEEFQDDHRAAELIRAILRAQARTAARLKEKKHDDAA